MMRSVLFDMDGVLVDSEPVINEAAILGLAEYGVHAVPEDFLPFVGTGEDRYIGGVAEKYGVKYLPEMKHRVYEIYLDIVPGRIRVFEGVLSLLEELKAHGVKAALASSADRIKIEANLKAAGIGFHLFGAMVSGEDVENKKPAPDIYLSAAGKLGVAPSKCIVVEDAVNGVMAALKAGMACVGVSSSFSSHILREAGAQRVGKDMHEVRDILFTLLGD